MEVAPFRALTHYVLYTTPHRLHIVEMEVAPFRALTHSSCTSVDLTHVEMKVAPFRALTLVIEHFSCRVAHGGNEGRPFQGIDTVFSNIFYSPFLFVEMKVASFRALTHPVCRASVRFPWYVEMKVASFGALTQSCDCHCCFPLSMWK